MITIETLMEKSQGHYLGRIEKDFFILSPKEMERKGNWEEVFFYLKEINVDKDIHWVLPPSNIIYLLEERPFQLKPNERLQDDFYWVNGKMSNDLGWVFHSKTLKLETFSLKEKALIRPMITISV